MFNYLQMPVAFPLILLMVEILHQLIGSPAMSIPISTRFYTPQVVIRISSINSIVLIWNFPPLLQPLKPGIQEQTISLKNLALFQLLAIVVSSGQNAEEPHPKRLLDYYTRKKTNPNNESTPTMNTYSASELQKDIKVHFLHS